MPAKKTPAAAPAKVAEKKTTAKSASKPKAEKVTKPAESKVASQKATKAAQPKAEAKPVKADTKAKSAPAPAAAPSKKTAAKKEKQTPAPVSAPPVAAAAPASTGKASKKGKAAAASAPTPSAAIPATSSKGKASKKGKKEKSTAAAEPDNAPAQSSSAMDTGAEGATGGKAEKKEEPEVMLRRRKSTEEGKLKKDIRLKELRKNKPQGQKVDFKRAERFVKDFRLREKDRVRFKKAAKTLSKFTAPEGEQVLLAIRTTPMKKSHPKTQKILQMLRLKNVNTGVFLKANKATQTMLKLVEPYVSWGTPSIKTIKELIFKRGFARVEKKRLPISNNTLIKEHLGEQGIICVEDIIHEIHTGGPNFKLAAGFLWPFKLSSPIVDRNKDEPIPGGNKDDKINEIAAIMT